MEKYIKQMWKWEDWMLIKQHSNDCSISAFISTMFLQNQFVYATILKMAISKTKRISSKVYNEMALN